MRVSKIQKLKNDTKHPKTKNSKILNKKDQKIDDNYNCKVLTITLK